MNEITVSQFVQLRDWIVQALRNSGQDVTTLDIALELMDFGDNHSLTALRNYWTWARAHHRDESEILATIVHDLNGRNDPGFEPRTSSY